MRTLATIAFAVAAVVSFSGTGQGQLIEEPDTEVVYASDTSPLPAVPAPAMPRVWYPESYTMMHGISPVAYQGGMPMAPGYYPQDPSAGMANGEYYDAAGQAPSDYGAQYLGDCAECGGGGCDACGTGKDRFWLLDAIPFRGYARFDYLYWTPRGYDVPALVTTSPQGTAQNVAGRLGQGTTNIAYGNEAIGDEWRPGARATFGIWLTPNELVGLEASYVRMQNSTESFQAMSTFSGGATPDLILARPYFNVDANTQDSVILAYPNFFTLGNFIDLDGSVNVQTHATIESAELVRRNVIWLDVFDGCAQSFLRVYFLGGYRYFRMDEDLQIDDVQLPVGAPFAPGSRIAATDIFETDNEFHGGQLGLFAEYARGPWGIEMMAKCALGNAHEAVRIQGGTTTFDGATTTVTSGGLLAQPTNIGRVTRDMFAVIPEANVNLTLQVTCNLKLVAGYSFIYYSNVVRPGDQIDFNVNPTQFSGGTLSGQASPVPLFNDSEYWIHGFNAGLEGRW